MNCSIEKANIRETSGIVREASFQEKDGLSSEQKINELLDKILDFKKVLTAKIQQIELLIKKLEEFTWYDIKLFDADTKKTMNDVISSTRDWSESLKRNHKLCLVTLAKVNLPIEQLDDLAMAIEDLDEANNDLEAVIFFNPHDEEFNSITNELIKL